MKKTFVRSLLISGLLFTPFIQSGERGFHTVEPEHVTDPLTNQPRITEDQNAAEALRLKIDQEEADEERLLASQEHHTKSPLATNSQLHTSGDINQVTVVGENTISNTNLSAKELAALKATEHHSFTSTTPSLTSEHPVDHHTPLNLIRPKIIRHLSNELITIKEKLTAEQIKSREMVIKFFDKAGELTKENLATFRTVYKKLAEWDGKSDFILTANEQKEMKLFLQSIISTYCTKRQTTEKGL